MVDAHLPAESQNPVQDPEDWTTGDEPMTGPQASYLKTLLQQAGREDDFDTCSHQSAGIPADRRAAAGDGPRR